MTSDPTIATLGPDDPSYDPYWIKENLADGERRLAEHLPLDYRNAVAQTPETRAWVTGLVDSARRSVTPRPVITTGRSLLILGLIRTGKTHEACGALRALSVSGAYCGWKLITAADIYAKMRPRHRIDSEEEYEAIANAPLLVIDDLGAAEENDRTEEINYRIINHRRQWWKPTIITSNVTPRELARVLGVRVTARLDEMSTRVVMTERDRRV